MELEELNCELGVRSGSAPVQNRGYPIVAKSNEECNLLASGQHALYFS